VCDLISLELQVTTQNVCGNGAAKVSDVSVIPDGWTTVIHADLTLADGVKFFNAARESVPKLEHGTLRINEESFLPQRLILLILKNLVNPVKTGFG
jgi:hypothetical protein